MTFKFDQEKAISAIKLVLNHLGGTCKFHKLFKILYFAEQKHLTKYGNPIFADAYIAMKDGPVPSAIYDILKIVKGESIYYKPELKASFSNFFTVQDHQIKLIDTDLDFEVFSESEIECIAASIEENKLLSFSTLAEKSHDLAWQSANKNQKIAILDIAKAGGANEELLKFILLNIENEHLFIK